MHFSATFYATVLAAASAVHAIPVPEPLPNLAATIAARRVRTNNGINATVNGVQYTNARNGADAACARGYTAWCNLGGTTTPGTTTPGTTTPGTTTPGTTTPGTTTPGTTTPGTTTPGTTTPGTTTPGTTTPGTTTPGTTTPGDGTTTDTDGDGVPDATDADPNDPDVQRREFDGLD